MAKRVSLADSGQPVVFPRQSLLVALVLTVALVLALAATARAHAFLVRTTPRAGERLAARPSEIVLWFSEPVVAGSEEIAVRTAKGDPVSLGPIERVNGGTRLHAGLPPLDEAIYVVSWSVLANDGHLAAGEFAFALGAGGQIPTGVITTSSAISWPDALASVLFLSGLVLAIGGLVSEAAIWGPVARQRAPAVPLAPVASGLLLSLAGAALQFIRLAGAKVGTEAADVWDPSRWGTVLATRPGLLTTVELGAVAYALWILRMRRLRVWALLPLTGAAVAAALRGHSGVSGAWWAVLANALHLILAGFWVGALLHLVLVLRRLRDEGLRELLSKAAQRYAGLALLAVPPLLVAGVITALAEFSKPAELVETTYGRVLLLKLLFVVAALALALIARLRALPAAPPRLDLLRRLTRAEGFALVAVLGVTAVLVTAATPRSVAAVDADLLGPAPLTGPVVRLASLAGQLTVYLAASEGELQVQVLEPGGEPAEAARVQIQGRSASGASLDLYPRSCGRGCFTMGFPWQEGTTALAVTVSSTKWPGGVVQFAVPWPPGPEAPELLDQVIRTMREQQQFTMTEQVSSGPGATAAPRTFPMTGPQFVAQEVYAAGGASDIRRRPGKDGLTELSLYIPGSAMWYQLGIDSEHRIRHELIVNHGHRIERTFSYEAAAGTLEREEIR